MRHGVCVFAWYRASRTILVLWLNLERKVPFRISSYNRPNRCDWLLHLIFREMIATIFKLICILKGRDLVMELDRGFSPVIVRKNSTGIFPKSNFTAIGRYGGNSDFPPSRHSLEGFTVETGHCSLTVELSRWRSVKTPECSIQCRWSEKIGSLRASLLTQSMCALEVCYGPRSPLRGEHESGEANLSLSINQKWRPKSGGMSEFDLFHGHLPVLPSRPVMTLTVFN
jgi:hypothetical protein